MQEVQNSLKNILLEPADAKRLAIFAGELNGNIKLIEKNFKVKIFHNGNKLNIKGADDNAQRASSALLDLYKQTQKNNEISNETIHLCIQEHMNQPTKKTTKLKEVKSSYQIHTPKKVITARGTNQEQYLKNIESNELNFGIGPAGTGKTYLAVAAGVHALLNDKVQKIILIRPAVEAGEKLGFLPGDLAQKVDPYLKPLYDALYEMLGSERVQKLIEKEIIEVAPLAYLRGRTLNNAFIIMDESQNTTIDQMKMFLTRMGYGSYAVVNGDLTQIDLPRNVSSGLSNVLEVLAKTENIGVIRFSSIDVVRHPLVRKIIDAYEAFKGSNN
ncbi:MAG: PhoH family protein [SAR86 cluster bacterium]|jgi:phosphate starvation-inducible PhoH-like protein|nr:PhoH family protein [SAR86 cluster bacterium]MDG1722084.1 PhoH family protein [SAR86 cluster bacterium]|tara:strand:+ start:595 stop:1581 length:987 start_codon:yes stop_codon:yes gene_type:complete